MIANNFDGPEDVSDCFTIHEASPFNTWQHAAVIVRLLTHGANR